jgi:hypothetical protein
MPATFRQLAILATVLYHSARSLRTPFQIQLRAPTIILRLHYHRAGGGPLLSARSTSNSNDRTLHSKEGLRWEQGFDQLLAYKASHGHCRVPNSFKSSTVAAAFTTFDPLLVGSETTPQKPIMLGRWVERQRSSWAKGTLDKDKCQRLQEVGFAWDPKQDEW